MKKVEGQLRVAISHVQPQVENGRFAIKRIVGDDVIVTADIFTDGHSHVTADLLFRHQDDQEWQKIPMQYLDNDFWRGRFKVNTLGFYVYTIQAWIDYFQTWQKDLEKKFVAEIDISVDMQMGLEMITSALEAQDNAELREWLEAIQDAESLQQQVKLARDSQLSLLMRDRYPNKQWVTEYPQTLPLFVDPPKALFSTWYEMFPRSASPDPQRHGTFKDCEKWLPYIAQMGFDVLYLPPIHPIGVNKRRGKSNQAKALETDVGSPWAIGSPEGGHMAIHQELGTLKDFEDLVKEAKKWEIDIALDIAFQCSVDHPYLEEHPNWFRWRADHTIQHAENPPKKYEDIVPFYFETAEWKELWDELRDIIFYWIQKGVRIFRVDNPHTKPFVFWEWLITTIKQKHPDIIFLAEAFTRPKVMYWLAKVGFTQSYTYFAWRHTKKELTEYLTLLTSAEINDYFRPNFWPNTPDILTEELQQGNQATFCIRLILAATLSSNYGIYGPPFELMIHEAVPGTEEYLNSEKYESRYWERDTEESLKELISRLNLIRKKNPALQQIKNLQFYEIDNEQILYFGKWNDNADNQLLIFVSLDPFHSQSGTFKVPLKELGLSSKSSYKVQELLLNRQHIWSGETQRITLSPQVPACIFSIQKKVKREVDFEYFI